MSVVTRTAIRRPLLVTMFFAGLALLGVVATTKLPVTELPKVDFPAVSIVVDDPGGNSQTIEQEVTKPIEQALDQVSGITEIEGTSATGISRVVAQLASGTDVPSAVNAISEAVGRVQRQLPSGASTPSITNTNPYATPLLTVNFSGQSPEELYNTVTSIVEPRLQLVSGVGQVALAGGLETNAQVELDPSLLEARGVTIAGVDQALTTSSSDVSAGTVTNGSIGTNVVTKAATSSLTSLAAVVVGSDGGAPVTLGEVATIDELPAAKQSTSRLDGAPDVSLTITPQDGANAIATDDAVRAALDALRHDLPAGVTSSITSDTSVFTRAALSATVEDLVLAVLLASLVIFLFLQSAREALVVLVAIPTSLLTTLLAMYLFRFSIDIVSLLALSLLVGILVDDAIVVLENVKRHLARGKPPAEAAYDGRTEIGAAAVALTLTDVVVFLPVVFASGVSGQILLEFGVTVATASMVSLLVSFTLTPMLAARWLRPSAPVDGAARGLRRVAGALERAVERATGAYAGTLRTALGMRPLVLAVGVAAGVSSVLLVTTGRLPSTYVPSEDTGVVDVSAQLPAGASLAAMDTALQQLATLVRARVPGVTTISTIAGSLGGVRATTDTGSMTIDLVAKGERPESAATAANEVSQLARLNVPGLRASATVPNPLVPPNGNGLHVVVRGTDETTVTGVAAAATTALTALPQLGQVVDTANRASASFDVAVNQVEAAQLGVTQQQVAETLATAIGGTQAGTLQTAQGTEEPIEVQLANPNLTESQLLDLPIARAGAAAGSAAAGSAAAGPPVTLGEVATVTAGSAPLVVSDYDELPEATVNTTIAAGSTPAAAIAAITGAMRTVHFPAGYDYVITGENQQQSTAFAPLVTALELSPLLVYLLLAALYESFVLPLCVLLAVPLATAGAFATLVWAGQSLNIFSLIGLLMLVGLVSKNAILLVDRAEALRRSGSPRLEAVVEAARARMRPIVMTTLTVVVAMLPIAFLSSPGSEDRAPMALVLVGGMTSSTLLTLFFVPTLYTYLDAARARRWRHRPGATAP